MSLLPSGAIETGGYNINNSLRFRSSASAYLNRTPASAGNRQIMTYSFWVKRGALTADYNLTNATTDASNSATLYFNSSNNQTFQQENTNSLANNRLILGVANKTININQCVSFIYVTGLTVGGVGSQNRWVLFSVT